MRFGWGYGGQMVYVVPDLGLTVVMTSETDTTRDTGHIAALHGLLVSVVAAAEKG